MITLIKNASYVIGYENEKHVIYTGGEVAYENDKILYVGKEYGKSADQIIDAKGGIVSPGLIDFHVNLDALLLEKSTIEDIGNPFHFMDDYYNLPDERSVSEELQEDIAEFAAAELISKGVTCVYAKGIPSEKVIEKLGASGIRTIYAPLAADSRIVKEEPEKMIYEELPKQYGMDVLQKTLLLRKKYENSFDGRMNIAVGLKSTDTCSEELLREAAKLMKEDKSLLLSIGAAQTVDEFIEVAYRYGITPAEYLHRLGIFGPRVQYVNYMMRSGHHMNTMILEGELSRIAEDETNVVNCPWRYGRRGIVMESFQKYHDLGINMGIGTDSSSLDMMLEMRYAAIFCKYAENVNPLKGKAGMIFNAATIDAAKALGRNDIGKLEAGCKADIIIVDIKNYDCSPMRDPVKSLVYTATGKNVSHVIIDGKTMVAGKKMVSFQKDDLFKRIQKADDAFESCIAMTFPVR